MGICLILGGSKPLPGWFGALMQWKLKLIGANSKGASLILSTVPMKSWGSDRVITRRREDQRGVMRRQLEEREDLRERREDRKEEREQMRHLQLIAALTRSPQPVHPQVTITQARYAQLWTMSSFKLQCCRPTGDIVMRTSVETLEQLMR